MIVVMSGMDYSDCYWREEGFKMQADNLFYPKEREFFSEVVVLLLLWYICTQFSHFVEKGINAMRYDWYSTALALKEWKSRDGMLVLQIWQMGSSSKIFMQK